MDIALSYGSQLEQSLAAKKYSNELESKCILSLVGAATNMYNMLVEEEDRIDLKVYLTKYDLQMVHSLFYGNLKTLEDRYNAADISMPDHQVKDVKSFLIKMWWMGYGQLPSWQGSKRDSTGYLNWNYFRKSLVYIMNNQT